MYQVPHIGKDTTEMLDLVDETFHQMAPAIPMSIVFPLFSGALMRRNYDFHTPFEQAIHERLNRIAPISDNPVKGKAF